VIAADISTAMLPPWPKLPLRHPRVVQPWRPDQTRAGQQIVVSDGTFELSRRRHAGTGTVHRA
jgi:hypothetical protein